MHTEDGNHQQKSSKLHAVGALLVHGLNGNPGDMDELTGFLASYGIVGLNVLLHSRGTDARERLPIAWLEWSSVVRKELLKLKQRCKDVFLIGHSLGGALCLHVAASESVAGIVTMCTPVYMYPWMFPAVYPLKHLNPVSPELREDACGYEARSHYKSDECSRKRMVSLESRFHYLPSLQTELPSVTAPALIMTAIHDYVVPASDGQIIYRLIGSQEKYLVKFRRSCHLLMKDHEREEVFARTLDFIESHASSPPIYSVGM